MAMAIEPEEASEEAASPECSVRGPLLPSPVEAPVASAMGPEEAALAPVASAMPPVRRPLVLPPEDSSREPEASEAALPERKDRAPEDPGPATREV